MNKSNNNNDLNNNGFRYDAFISYRHLNPDQKVAEKLHRLLEAFNLPNKLKSKHVDGSLKNESTKDIPQKTKINRVFRDQEELPLAQNLQDPIIEALKSTEWLIVICSSRLQQSEWCKMEIDTFLKLRGREYILVVLAEGDAIESVPRNLWPKELQSKEVLEPEEKRRLYDVDFRTKSEKSLNKCMKDEYIRLVAPIFSEDYLELRNAYMSQKHKREVIRYSALSAVAVAVSIYFVATGINLYNQNLVIKEQYDTICQEKSQQLANRAFEYLEEDDRENAIRCSYIALTEYESKNNDVAKKAMYDALGIYKQGDNFEEEYQILGKGSNEYLYGNESCDVVVMYDESQTITGWDYKNKKPVFMQSNVHLGPYSAGLTDNGIFAYIDNDQVVLIDVATGKESMTITDIEADSLYVNGTDVFVSHGQYVSLIDTKEKEYIGDYYELSCVLQGNQDYNQIPYIDRDYCVFLGGYDNSTISEMDNMNDLVGFAGSTWNKKGVLNAYGPRTKGVDDYHAIGESFLNSDGIFDKECIDVKFKNGLYYILSTTKDNRPAYSRIGTATIAKKSKLMIRDIGDKGTYNDFEYDNFNAKSIYPMTGDDGREYCLILSDYSGILVDLENGQIVKTEIFTDKLTDAIVLDDENVLCICMNTKEYLFSINQAQNKKIEFDFNGVRFKNFIKLDENTYVASIENYDNVIFYTYKQNQGTDETTMNVSIDNNIDNQIISQWISADTEEVDFYGRDKDKNYYFGANNTGYIISDNGQLIAEITDFAGADTGNNKIYFKDANGNLYSKKLYVVDDMIDYVNNNYTFGCDTSVLDTTSGLSENYEWRIIDNVQEASIDDVVTIKNTVSNVKEEAVTEQNGNGSWQQSYAKILEDVIATVDIMDSENYGYNNYSLCDLDGDGIPEMILNFATCSMDDGVAYFTCDESGNVSSLGFSPKHHTSYYYNPDDYSLYSYFVHMGYISVAKLKMENGEIVTDGSSYNIDTSEMYAQDPDYKWPTEEELMPGAKSLMHYPLTFSYAIDLYTGVSGDDHEILEQSAVEAKFEAVMNNQEKVYFVAASPKNLYDKKLIEGEKYLEELYTGEDFFKDYMVELYTSNHSYYDFDGDGQLECLLWYEAKEGYTSGLILLSIQDGQIYGYVENLTGGDKAVIEDGMIVRTMGEYSIKYKFIYCKEQGVFV